MKPRCYNRLKNKYFSFLKRVMVSKNISYISVMPKSRIFVIKAAYIQHRTYPT